MGQMPQLVTNTMKIFLAYFWVSAIYAAPLNSRQFPDLRSVLTNPANVWSAGTVVSFAGSDEFHNSTARWTITGAPTFSAAISPANEEDVITAVRDSEENGNISVENANPNS